MGCCFSNFTICDICKLKFKNNEKIFYPYIYENKVYNMCSNCSLDRISKFVKDNLDYSVFEPSGIDCLDCSNYGTV